MAVQFDALTGKLVNLVPPSSGGGGGGGDVNGPSDAINNGVATFDGTDGKTIQGVNVTIEIAGNNTTMQTVSDEGSVGQNFNIHASDGDADANTAGGDIQLFAGTGGGSSGHGGQLDIQAGGSNNNGGDLNITAGSAANAGDGGQLNISSGSTTGSGNGGNIVIMAGSSDSGNAGNISIKLAPGNQNGTFKVVDADNNIVTNTVAGGLVFDPNKNIIFTSGDGNNNVNIGAADALSEDLQLVLPDNAGNDGDALTTDGSGNLSWSGVASKDSATLDVGDFKMKFQKVGNVVTVAWESMDFTGAGTYVEIDFAYPAGFAPENSGQDVTLAHFVTVAGVFTLIKAFFFSSGFYIDTPTDTGFTSLAACTLKRGSTSYFTT